MKLFEPRKIIIGLLVGASTMGCVQQTHLKTITFKVDVRGMETISRVGVKGNFSKSPWNEVVDMTDTNGDGIHEVTITKKTGQNGLEFKFVDQKGDYELQNRPNRTLQFQYKPEQLVYEGIFNNPEGITSTKN
jgi:hypothetical protein